MQFVLLNINCPLPYPFLSHTESDSFVRQWCGPMRSFSMAILDNAQKEVIGGIAYIHVLKYKFIMHILLRPLGRI